MGLVPSAAPRLRERVGRVVVGMADRGCVNDVGMEAEGGAVAADKTDGVTAGLSGRDGEVNEVERGRTME